MGIVCIRSRMHAMTVWYAEDILFQIRGLSDFEKIVVEGKRWRGNVLLGCEIIVPNHSKQLPLCNPALIDHRVTEDSHIFCWGGMVSLVSWYDSIPFYFCIFSISTLMLTHYDAQYPCDASCKLCEPMWSCALNAWFLLSFYCSQHLYSVMPRRWTNEH